MDIRFATRTEVLGRITYVPWFHVLILLIFYCKEDISVNEILFVAKISFKLSNLTHRYFNLKKNPRTSSEQENLLKSVSDSVNE